MVVANHPFGVLDGLIICEIVSRVRHDFRVLTNAVLLRADEVKEFLLPVDFAETEEALKTNLRTRAEAKAHPDEGRLPGRVPGRRRLHHAHHLAQAGGGHGMEELHPRG